MPEDATSSNRTEARDRMRLTLETVLGVPFTTGNSIEAFRNGDEIFPPMLEAIRQAEHRIEFLTFVYWKGDIAERFVDALTERARAGVKVMSMLDGFGAHPMPEELVERLQRSGVEVRWFRPLPRFRLWQSDNRTHRKILVCDGKVGFTGGVGIAQEWQGDARNPEEWRDTHFRILGPAVLGLRGAFYEDWMERSLSVKPAVDALYQPDRAGEVEMQVVLSTASVGRSDVAALNDALILTAEKRLRICTAYFSPTPDTANRLRNAAGRGVEVEILIPGPHVDKRASELSGSNEIGPLLKSGIKIWKFQPTMLHAKLITVDGVLASVGSANFNHRSVRKDDEIAVNVLDNDFTDLMDRHFDKDLERSELITYEDWQNRGLLRRAREAVVSLVTSQT